MTARTALALAMAAAALPAAALLAQPATRPADAAPAGLEAAELAARVLLDPLNADLRRRLQRLRRRQRAERRQGCEALARGLSAYLRAGPEPAEPALRQANRSPRARALAAGLPKKLPELLALAEKAEEDRRLGRRTLCPRCGNTGEVACTAVRCYGSGKVSCTKCRGTGRLSVRRHALQPAVQVLCDDCGGMGVVNCEACGGTGRAPCPACDAGEGPPPAPLLRAGERRAIREAIDKARWLRDGYVNLVTPDALAPAPRRPGRAGKGPRTRSAGATVR